MSDRLVIHNIKVSTKAQYYAKPWQMIGVRCCI